MSTFESTTRSLTELLREIGAGVIQLPEFQRGWIWDDDQIQDLLVSIAGRFPIGTVTLLECADQGLFKTRALEGFEKIVPRGCDPEQLILDGQQRLTSLARVLLLDTPVDTCKASRKSIRRYYYIDISRAVNEGVEGSVLSVDESREFRDPATGKVKFKLKSSEQECRAKCFPCHLILQSDDWEAEYLKINPGDGELLAAFRETVLNAFRQYTVTVSQLKRDTPIESVSRVFQRANLGGAQLTVFEILNAKYAAAGFSLRDDWHGSLRQNIVSRKARIARNPLLEDIEETDFIQAVTLLHTHDLRLKALAKGRTGKQLVPISAKRNDVLSLPLDAWKNWATQLEAAYEHVAYFLRAEALYHRRELPYRVQLVPLVSLMARIGDRWRETQNRDKIARWFWCGILGELYDGAVEERLAMDYEELLIWLDNTAKVPTTVREACFSPSRFDVLHTRNSAAYKGVALLVLREGAEDWYWRTSIRDLKIYEISIDIHNIFPRAWCDSQRIPRSRYDSILNKTLLSYKANRKIASNAPADYIAKLQADKQVGLTDEAMDAVLATHALSPELLREGDFYAFVEDRRSRLCDLVELAMGKVVSRAGD
ncbi:GmrSD restriction endonuclease domain-containing protein [Granulosicoccus sp. 3-233]|uniref:GmrSD restriction endonuclease domain-containing protein n=1 Tax=Granulosicoccus sp. 3-233 TaxID=3417969 RepID=UPI003D3328A2